MPQRGMARSICRPPRISILLFKPSCQCLKKPNQIRLRVAHPFIFNDNPSVILALNPSVIKTPLNMNIIHQYVGQRIGSGIRVLQQ